MSRIIDIAGWAKGPPPRSPLLSCKSEFVGSDYGAQPRIQARVVLLGERTAEAHPCKRILYRYSRSRPYRFLAINVSNI